MIFNKVTHCIFDMDGLLIDSESVYDQIIGSIAEQFGKDFTLEVKLKMLGLTERDTAIVAIREMDLPVTNEEFLKIYREKVRQGQLHPKLMPGVQELIKHLYKNDVPMAVATSSSQTAVDLKTKDHQHVFKMFQHIVCGSSDPDVANGKPAPDIFLVAARRFADSPHPSKCLVFEDAPNGIVGAAEAGMQSVMVPDPQVNAELRKQATLVLNSLTAFKPELFGLPRFE
ncbi:probable pseudouridine-5'-phosphatase [Cylas formicarius]|uniref:probable pseudouridine-5'-phosphatase n=1 Tax=Cylas formicarius TaxID=197179 RepID=UPI00295875C8|nr:probable pseudouridine-5'-phosphatase [Cylas formicarius]